MKRKYTYYLRKGLTKKATAPSGAGYVRRVLHNKKRKINEEKYFPKVKTNKYIRHIIKYSTK